ncbi:MAG: hypothetical protein KatS3mg122_1119 [Caldimonas sp.]|nr:MAG: hypothetical protein KatS3mg122_1119 [Caldimonas sp.]
MNRYPLWKYAILVVAVIVGFIYTLPNFFGEAPAVQVSSGKATVRVDDERGRTGPQALAPRAWRRSSCSSTGIRCGPASPTPTPRFGRAT